MLIKDKELPGYLKEKFNKAKKLEWFTILYLISVVFLMYLVMGSSQAMKTAWLEDLFSITPSISFLIAASINAKKPRHKFPYGYHRVFGIAFLMGALALLLMGLYVTYESLIALIKQDYPTIGTVSLMGYHFWMGWLMIAVLIYSTVPAVIIGQIKKPLARKLHNKILHTDADAQKADYMTAMAAMAGVLGIGMGWWWADSLAALLISLSIVKDGFTNIKTAILDLMDRHPVKIGSNKNDPLVEKIQEQVESWPWVKKVRVRFREHGQIYFGEIHVIPLTEKNLSENIKNGISEIKEFDWKIHDVTITPVPEFDEETQIT